MLVVRKEGKAHDRYNSFRSAFELLEAVGREPKDSYEEMEEDVSPMERMEKEISDLKKQNIALESKLMQQQSEMKNAMQQQMSEMKNAMQQQMSEMKQQTLALKMENEISKIDTAV